MSSEEVKKSEPEPQPEKDIEINIFKDAINPGICFFTCLFKLMAITRYILY